MYTKQEQYLDILDLLKVNGLSGEYLAAHIQEELFTIYGVAPLGEIPESNLWAIIGKHRIGVEAAWRP